MIGLLSAALAPGDEDDWRRFWSAPPSRSELQGAIDRLPDAFNIDGDGPRFFQDFATLDFESGEASRVEQLLMDAPGDQTIKLNKDLFVKRGSIETMSRPGAAMALITLQTYAPSGGQGHRTSLRGGGPLTTLVDPRNSIEIEGLLVEQPLWLKLWANAETLEQLALRVPTHRSMPTETAFPWLAPTRTSNLGAGGKSTTPSDTHPLQAYFGMPRRIRLVFGDPGTCDLTGEHDEKTVVGFKAINYGVKYDGWRHPLSPYYRTKPEDQALPVHGQPDGVGWRDWISLTLEAPVALLREPAATVATFARRGETIGIRRQSVHVFGYDMDNMKARGWVDAVLPLLLVKGEERRQVMYNSANAMVEATSIAASALLFAIKEVLFKGDKAGDIGHVRSELWNVTAATFFGAMELIAFAADEAQAVGDAQKQTEGFADVLQREVLTVFDRWCPCEGTQPDLVRRRVTSRYNLRSTFAGHGKLGKKLHDTLGISSQPTDERTRAGKKKNGKQTSTTSTRKNLDRRQDDQNS
jgi:CRISPR system Cascade subunit CasA